VLGANSFSGTNNNTNRVVGVNQGLSGQGIRRAAANFGADPFFTPNFDGLNRLAPGTPRSGGAPIANSTEFQDAFFGATTFNYDLRLNLDTSFTGKDLLRTVLRAGNFAGVDGNASGYGNGLSTLETAFEHLTDNTVGVNRLFYNFPMGSELSLTAGPLVRVDDAGMLGLWPSAYPADTILDFFTYVGAPGAYNLAATGGGAGFVYSPKFVKGVTISQNYVSAAANNGNPNFGGVFTQGAPSAAVTQVGYVGDKAPLVGGSYGLAFAYTYSQNLAVPIGTPLAGALSGRPFGAFGVAGESSANNYGLSGYWKPEKAGIVPSISWGFGGGSYNVKYNAGGIDVAGNAVNGKAMAVSGITMASWYTGLQWDDAFIKGNAAGMAVGQAPFVTQLGSAAFGTPRANLAAQGYANGAQDSNYLWEWWYKFQLTDNISLTPALYYITNYGGQYGRTNNSNGGQGASNNLFGGLIKTTFKF